MKNLKIGAKVLLSFLLVIVFLAAIAVTVVVTNVTSNNDVREIDTDSDLQTLSKVLTNNFATTRLDAREMYLTTSEQSYTNVKAGLNEVKDDIQALYGMIDSNAVLAQYRSMAQDVETAVSLWETEIDAVGASNRDLVTLHDGTDMLAGALKDAADSAYRNQQSLWRNESANPDLSYDDKIRRADRLDGTIVFLEDIEEILNEGTEILVSFESEGSDTLLANIERVLADLQGFIDSAKNQGTKDSAKVTIDTLTPYRDAIVAFCDAIATNDAAIERAIVQGAATLKTVDDLSVTLGDAMNSAIDRTLSSNSMALLISVIVTVLAIIVAVIVAVVLMRGITNPVNHMREYMTIVGGTGRMAFSDEENRVITNAMTRDEIGQTMRSFSDMMKRLQLVSSGLERVANGDLTVELAPLSRDDTMGNATVKMIENLNSMFSEINMATAQVSTGANQIADGAQALAQGSTEQAAAVEQLSSSINEIAHMTRANAEKANQAAGLSDSIKQNAEKGSVQMGQMMQAVREINEASRSIGNVIKVIDDIAFQTNILALNAAVEAARAGQHGKGFAVVAEEVRNLAAKSAEAAKDTGGLIANSMEKAELGARIAGETSASLNEIVSGVNESTQIIADIARSSEEQSAGISQINTGIDQVAQVVQQNSATAEESAAASEEMSGQSNMLQGLVGRFTLKNHTGSSALPASASPRKQLNMPPKTEDSSGDFGKY